MSSGMTTEDSFLDFIQTSTRYTKRPPFRRPISRVVTFPRRRLTRTTLCNSSGQTLRNFCLLLSQPHNWKQNRHKDMKWGLVNENTNI